MNRLEFLKKLGIISVGAPLLSSLDVMAESKIIYDNYPIITDEFEVFDEALYQAMKKNELGDVFQFLKDGSFLEMWKNKNFWIHRYYPFNSYFYSSKKYYSSNGYIMRKFIGYVMGFAMGLCYEFDEQGHLIKTTDYDAPYTFTFEDILAYCKAHKISVTKGYRTGVGFQNSINRLKDDEYGYCWIIEHLIGIGKLESIYLDGKTGKEIKKEISEYHY